MSLSSFGFAEDEAVELVSAVAADRPAAFSPLTARIAASLPGLLNHEGGTVSSRLPQQQSHNN